MEPFVKILYSESKDTQLQAGSILSLGNANISFEQRDCICIEHQCIENLVYEIYYTVNGETRNYCCSQNLGDGEGSVINHLRKETLNSLETLSLINFQENSLSSKNPFHILRTSCENMLNVILPELEVYCLAFRAFEIVFSYRLDNCDIRLQKGIDSLMSLIKDDANSFVDMLYDVIAKNPENTSLIFSVESLLDKIEIYLNFVAHKTGEKEKLVDILKEASQRASIINSNSIFYNAEPPPIENEYIDIPCG